MALLKPQSDVLRDPLLALSLLTRLPIKLDEKDYAKGADAAWAYPLVGLVTGTIAVFAVWLALWLGFPQWCAALFAIAAGVVATGAMHEDGLADCADGFWGGWDPAMRLKIMKDSQIGTYGVLTLLAFQGLRFGAVLSILQSTDWALSLIAIHVASRAVMPVIMATLPHARDTGLARSVGKVSSGGALSAILIGDLALFVAFGSQAIWLISMVALATLCLALLAKRKIGGQTGDLCGASQQLAEITLLLCVLT